MIALMNLLPFQDAKIALAVETKTFVEIQIVSTVPLERIQRFFVVSR